MPSDDIPQDGPSIAPPSLGFGFRRRKKGGSTEETATSEPETTDAVVEPELVEPEPVVPDDDEPTVFVPMVAPATTVADSPQTAVAAPAAKKARRERPPKEPKEPRAPKEPRPPRDLSLPGWLQGRVAATLTGLLVGLFIVAATVLALQGCTAVRGTPSCGGGPGFFLLVAILLLGILLGAALLRLADVPSAGSTSFLAVGLTSVLSVLVLVDHLLDWWMIIAIPLISIATFVLSHWVSTTFAETTD